MANEKTWFEIHAYCGDCGRRIKQIIDTAKTDLKTSVMLVKSYHEPGNMACTQCSMNKQRG